MSNMLTIICPGHTLLGDIETYGVVGDVMVVNRSIADYSGDIKYAVSIHRHLLLSWLNDRMFNGYNVEHVYLMHDGTECPLAINTSGLLALWQSQQLDYDEVRVLGMPADNGGHYYDTDGCDNAAAAVDFEQRFPFDNEEWLAEFSKWKNIRIASGNLLKLFPQIDLIKR